MARKSWSSLSPAYRTRLQKAGITQSVYETGASLSAARGHAHTPERPERAATNPQRYTRYLSNRNRLVQMVVDRKRRLFGHTERYNPAHAYSYVKDGVPNLPGYEQKPPGIAELQKALKMTDDEILTAARSQAPEKSYWWYH